MSDPGTTYRTRDEVQKMRSTQDPIRGLQKYIEDWGLATEEELKAIDKESKTEVDKAVEEAKTSPEPDMNDFWTDIYYKGTEPPFMRGREREEVSSVQPSPPHSSTPLLTTNLVDSLLLNVISYRSRTFTVRLTLPSVEYSHCMLRGFRLPKSCSRPDGVVGFCEYQLRLPLVGGSSLTRSATTPVLLALRQLSPHPNHLYMDRHL